VEIRINKTDDVPVREQLARQIVYLIATEKLRPGTSLPSVRELARQLRIHHNTVSEAYQALVRRGWLVHRRGSRLVVRGQDEERRNTAATALDDLIDQTIDLARRCGYSLQELRGRVKERLMAEPPDHILVVEEEAGLRSVLEEEIRAAGRWPVEGCSCGELQLNPGLAVGALIAAPQYAVGELKRFASREFPAIALAFSNAEEQLALVRKRHEPSVIALVSVSKVFLSTARGLLAPALGERHSLVEHLLPLKDGASLRGADIVLCDSLAYARVKSKQCIAYRLIDRQSMEYLMGAMAAYQTGERSTAGRPSIGDKTRREHGARNTRS
jgi:GntR family transcriptional regulator